MSDGRLSYSQFGEDMLITQLLPAVHGFYVDIGCHDPFRYSNTALLHERGWAGINVDADARAIERFKTARPQAINLHCGVGAQAGVKMFSRFKDGAVNSFDETMAAQQRATFGEPDRVEMRIETLAGVLAAHLPAGQTIDYLNIDCEGLDYDVLTGNDWSRFVPKLISVELHQLNPAQPLDNIGCRYLLERGYLFRGHYFCTSIFHHLSAL